MSRPGLSPNLKLFSTKQRPRHNRHRASRHRASPQQIVAIRLREFSLVLHDKYGHVLPDNDDSRYDLEPVIHHFAALSQPRRRTVNWLSIWAPWLTLRELEEIITRNLMRARPWSADQLAWRYRITKEDRRRLRLTTIGAMNESKATRTKQRKHRDRQRKAAIRRAKGSIPRAKYEANALTQTKPWEAENISRATWYRRRSQATETETGSSTA